MSGPTAGPGLLHVIIGGCATTKLLLMRFHMRPSHRASWLIHLKIIHSQRQSLAKEQREGLSSEKLASVSTFTGKRGPAEKYHYPRGGYYRRGVSSKPTRVIKSNVLSVPRLTNADLADGSTESVIVCRRNKIR